MSRWEKFKQDIATTVDAQFRQGAKELAQVLPAFGDSIRPVEEMGLPGNPTPQSISMDQGLYGYRRDYEREPMPEVEMDMD